MQFPAPHVMHIFLPVTLPKQPICRAVPLPPHMPYETRPFCCSPTPHQNPNTSSSSSCTPVDMSHRPLLRFLFSFVFSALFLPCTICHGNSSYQFCLENVKCGDTEIEFPFGIKGNGHACGDPHFPLVCLPDGSLLLIGTNNNYSILHTNSEWGTSKVGGFDNDHRITIVNEKAWGENGSCDPSAFSIDYLDFNYFTFDNRYTTKTFYADCQITPDSMFIEQNCSGWYSSNTFGDLDPNVFNCQKRATVQIRSDYERLATLGGWGLLQHGFPVVWRYDNETKIQSCEVCLSNGGYCGYKISNGDFLCHCKDGQQSNKCPNANDRSSRRKSIALIGGSTGAALLAAAVALLLIFYKLNNCFPKRGMQHNLGIKAVNSRTSFSQVEKFLEDFAFEMPTRYSYFELEQITNNFSFKLGEGGFGVVYRGTLSNGTLVAAKLLDQSRHGERQFMNEVGTIGRIHHVHLVRLLGFCFEGSRSALLYEYMPNGSLEKFIFPGYKDTSHTLNWERLYSIALGAARGIAYLHTDCQKRIIHLDIKPHNVLLDENLSPKVSDFGLARLYRRGDDHISITAARGTPGYAAPEMWSRNFGPVTDKSDVYSFGMLLLEMVGGRKNMDVRLGVSNSQFYFPEWIFHRLDGGELQRLTGISSGSVEDEGRAMRMCKVGLWCIQSKPSDRPSMSRVVQMLEGNGNDISNPPLPFDMPITAPEAPLLSASTPIPTEYSLSNEIDETV